MRLTLWLARHGFTDERLRTDLGIYTKGGRQPDLTAWRDAAPDVGAVSVYVPVDGQLSRKARSPLRSVRCFEGRYEQAAPRPLEWVLAQTPTDLGLPDPRP